MKRTYGLVPSMACFVLSLKAGSHACKIGYFRRRKIRMGADHCDYCHDDDDDHWSHSDDDDDNDDADDDDDDDDH